jgi:hypothetical protein
MWVQPASRSLEDQIMTVCYQHYMIPSEATLPAGRASRPTRARRLLIGSRDGFRYRIALTIYEQILGS